MQLQLFVQTTASVAARAQKAKLHESHHPRVSAHKLVFMTYKIVKGCAQDCTPGPALPSSQRNASCLTGTLLLCWPVSSHQHKCCRRSPPQPSSTAQRQPVCLLISLVLLTSSTPASAAAPPADRSEDRLPRVDCPRAERRSQSRTQPYSKYCCPII